VQSPQLGGELSLQLPHGTSTVRDRSAQDNGT
jgi:hypothetical protein